MQVDGKLPENIAYMETVSEPIEPRLHQMYDPMHWWTPTSTEPGSRYCGMFRSPTGQIDPGVFTFLTNACTLPSQDLLTICEYGMLKALTLV